MYMHVLVSAGQRRSVKRMLRTRVPAMGLRGVCVTPAARLSQGCGAGFFTPWPRLCEGCLA